MRILQQFPVADDPTIARVLSPILQHVISTGADTAKSQNKNNAVQAIMVEAVGLVMVMERDQELVDLMSAQLGRFITAREPNTRRVASAQHASRSHAPLAQIHGAGEHEPPLHPAPGGCSGEAQPGADHREPA